MNITVKTILGLLIAGGIYSCTQQAESEQIEVKETKNETHQNIHESLSLNNGERWMANAETTEGVNNMILLMDSFSDTESVAAYAELSKELKNEFQLIFEKCTMTGESHNQLHHFLVPIKGWMKQMNSTELDSCKKSYSALKSHLKEYQKFFE